jgi:hypothetical protein
MKGEHYIEELSLSVAWAKALRLASARGRSEIAPLTVSITGFDESGMVNETRAIRSAIDRVLAAGKKQTVETVANTIFPNSLWNPSAPRTQLFERYHSVLPKLRKDPKNRRGIYFERMITGGPAGRTNQLEHAISMYKARASVRRSALQTATFDPSKDHSTSAQLGFPCLQHVAFTPSDGALNVNAIYATQYLVERGYGNYLGLCRLGRFVAQELGLRLGRLTCLVGLAKCDLAKGKVSSVFTALDAAIKADSAAP